MTEPEASVIYLSAVPGHLVPRFSTLAVPGGRTYIGGRRDPETGKIEVNPEAVVRIPLTEFGRHLKEYNRAIEDGALKRRDAKEFDAWREARRKQMEAEHAAQAKAIQEAADAAKAKAEAAKPSKSEALQRAERAAQARADAEAVANAKPKRKRTAKGKKSETQKSDAAPVTAAPVVDVEAEGD
jgi:hypothetical protein